MRKFFLSTFLPWARTSMLEKGESHSKESGRFIGKPEKRQVLGTLRRSGLLGSDIRDGSTKRVSTSCQLTTICLIYLHGTKCSTIAFSGGFMVYSCVWLCRGFSGSNPGNGTKYKTMVCTARVLNLGTVSTTVLWLCPVAHVFPDSLSIFSVPTLCLKDPQSL